MEKAVKILKPFFREEESCQIVVRRLYKIAKKDTKYFMYLVYEFISEYTMRGSLSVLLKSVQKEEIGWNHVLLAKEHGEYRAQDEYILNPPTLEEGVIECGKCHGRRTFSFTKQTRRADESTTVFVRCGDCRNTFRL